MNHIWHALATYRSNCKVHVSQPKGVGRHFFQRETMRCKLLQGKFTRFVAVPTRALDGYELHRDFGDREVRKFRHFSLNHDRSTLALERVDSEQHWKGSRARCAIEHHIHALAIRDLHDASERILLLHVDHMVSS